MSPVADKLTDIKVIIFAVSTVQRLSGLAFSQLQTSQHNFPPCFVKSKVTELQANCDFPKPSFSARRKLGRRLFRQKIKASHLRAAFDLVSSLHFSGDQSGAANTALAGLQGLIHADRWAIYLFSETKGFEGATLEAVAVRQAGDRGFEE